MEILLYTLVVFLATALGATSGAGGGSIIKPVFDGIGVDNATVIGLYSTVAVFSMCLSSIYKHRRIGLAFNRKILYGLSLGSFLGGYSGDWLFRQVASHIPNHRVIFVQSILLFIVLFLIFLFTRFEEHFPKFSLTRLPFIFLAGLFVGALSAFLGIGGGALNVVILVVFFTFTTKDAAPYSLAMIFFSKIPAIFQLFVTSPPMDFRWEVVPFIVFAALAGGNVGTRMNRYFSAKRIHFIYSGMMLSLLLLCLYNIFSNR